MEDRNVLYPLNVISFLAVTLPVLSYAANNSSSAVWTKGTNMIYSSTYVHQWIQNQMNSADFELTIRKTHLKQTTAINDVVCVDHGDRIIASDSRLRGISIYNRKTQKETLVYKGSSTGIGQIAIDWHAQNIYWIDQGYCWIAVKSLTRFPSVKRDKLAKKVIIDTYIEYPTGLAVSSDDNYIFWADAGTVPKIERTNLYGKERKVIAWRSLYAPSSLAIDAKINKLFWADIERETIEYSNFDGLNRIVLISYPGAKFYDVALFQGVVLYTTETSTGYVYTKRKILNSLHTDAFTFDKKQIERVSSCDDTHQPKRQSATCKRARCGNICFQNKQNYTMCSCPDEYDLMHDGSCNAIQNVLEKHIVFTNKTNICAVSMRLLGLEKLEPLDLRCDIITSNSDIKRFQLDMVKNTVIFTDGKYLYKQEAFSKQRHIIYESRKSIEDMSFDWFSKQVYWIESNDSSIYYMDIDGDTSTPSTRLFPGLLKLKRLTSVPQNKQIFLLAENSTSGYDILFIWDRRYDEIRSTDTKLHDVNDLEYDIQFDKIYILGESIQVGSFTGSRALKFEKQYQGGNLNAITAYKKFIIATSNDGQFNVFTMFDKRTFNVSVTSNNKTWPVQDLHIFDYTLQPLKLEKCWINNGGCEHICLRDVSGTEGIGIDGRNVECACHLGYTLDTDNLSCKTKDDKQSDFYVVLDKDRGKLYTVNKYSHVPYAIDTGKSSKVVAFSKYCKGNGIVWLENEFGKQGVKVKQFGHSAVKLENIELDNASHLAVDDQCNIYVSSRKEIKRFDLNSSSRTLIHTKNSSDIIRNIAVSPVKRFISWTQVIEKESKIMLSNTDGSDIRVIRNTGRKSPDDVAFDPDPNSNSLFWCISDLGFIERVDFNTKKTYTVIDHMNFRPFAIDITGDDIYAADKDYGKLITLDKNTGSRYAVALETPYLMIADISIHFKTGSTIQTNKRVYVPAIIVCTLILLVMMLCVLLLRFRYMKRRYMQHLSARRHKRSPKGIPKFYKHETQAESFPRDQMYETLSLNEYGSQHEQTTVHPLELTSLESEDSTNIYSSTPYCLVGFNSNRTDDFVDSLEANASSENLGRTIPETAISKLQNRVNIQGTCSRVHTETGNADKERSDDTTLKRTYLNFNKGRPLIEYRKGNSYSNNTGSKRRKSAPEEECNEKCDYKPVNFENGQDVPDGIVFEPISSYNTTVRECLNGAKRFPNNFKLHLRNEIETMPSYKSNASKEISATAAKTEEPQSLSLSCILDNISQTASNDSYSIHSSKGCDVPDCPTVDCKLNAEIPNEKLNDKALSKILSNNELDSIPKSEQSGTLSNLTISKTDYAKSNHSIYSSSCVSATENKEQNPILMEQLKSGVESTSITLRKTFENNSSSSRIHESCQNIMVTNYSEKRKQPEQRFQHSKTYCSMHMQVLKSGTEQGEHLKLSLKNNTKRKNDIHNAYKNGLKQLKSVIPDNEHSPLIPSLAEMNDDLISGFAIVTNRKIDDAETSKQLQRRVERLPQENNSNNKGKSHPCSKTDQTKPKRLITNISRFSRSQTSLKCKVTNSLEVRREISEFDCLPRKSYEEEKESGGFCSIRSSCSTNS